MPSCPSCGAEGLRGALFCASCGSRLVSKPEGDSFVGRTLNGTYFIQQKIGSGGMGDVYKAIHQKLDAPVALKIVKRELLGHPAMVHRFEREARAASKLRHPNVVAVTDFGQAEDGTLFMVMEYMPGKSLARVIAADAPMSEQRVVHIGAQILSALSEAHANDILHRDLKPENIMIETRRDVPDAVKVLDFGIAKVLAGGGSASTLTQAGLVCGTPGYMSPEQLRGAEIDARSDLFSVGVVLYEMLTHKLPFDVQTPMEMLHRHLSEPIVAPSERRSDPVSPELEAVVMKALASTRDARPAGADEMRAQLLRAALTSDQHEPLQTELRLPTEILQPRNSPAPVTPVRPAPPASQPPRRVAPPATAVGSGTAQSAQRLGTAAPPVTPPPRTRETRATRTGPTERTRSSPTVTRATPSAAAATGTPTDLKAFDPAVLKQIERRIAPMLGPVAPYLVKKVSRTAATIDDVCHQLASFIHGERDQKDFLGWAAAQLSASPPRRSAAATPVARTPLVDWDPAVLDRARRDLAVHLGPLARVIVRRVCCQAHDVGELYELLAREIPSEIERELFWRRAPADARH